MQRRDDGKKQHKECLREQDQSSTHKQHKQASNCNAKQSAALSMVEYF